MMPLVTATYLQSYETGEVTCLMDTKKVASRHRWLHTFAKPVVCVTISAELILDC